MEDRKYIYGVIKCNAKDNLDVAAKEHGVDRVYTIAHKDIACAVSDSSISSFNLMEKEELGHHLVNHQSIIEKIMKSYTVIPFKFGTVAEDTGEVKRILELGYSDLKERLDRMDGKLEFNLIAMWRDLNSVIKRIGEEDEKIRDFKEEIAKRPPEETLQKRIKIGAMIKDALDKKKNKLQCEMIDSLKINAIDFKKHEIMDDKMILNCAFLLDEDKEKEFDKSLNELNESYDEKVNFRCIGPLPPYSFSTIEVKKMGFDEIDEARKLLELGEAATLSEIKDSYHRLSKTYHPDKDPGNPGLGKQFEKITKAYKILARYCSKGECSFDKAKTKDFFAIDVMKI